MRNAAHTPHFSSCEKNPNPKSEIHREWDGNSSFLIPNSSFLINICGGIFTAHVHLRDFHQHPGRGPPGWCAFALHPHLGVQYAMPVV